MRALLVLLAVLSFGFSAVTADEAQPAPETRVVILHHPGPAWDKTKSFRDQAGVAEHIAHYRQMLESGQLALGGPFLDDTGGMMVSVPGADLEALQDFAASDPAVKSGLLIVEIHPWLIGMKAD